jgi:hypothetical protein
MQPAYAERLEPILKASKVFLFSICFREVFSHYFLVGKGGSNPEIGWILWESGLAQISQRNVFREKM